MNNLRRKRVESFASIVADHFHFQKETDLMAIISDEGISFHEDDYSDCFDGMLTYSRSRFHLHCNTFKGNRWNSKKGRFTIAHELGHYFINEHRYGLMKGLLSPHGSNGVLAQNALIEKEADYFAANLLMPRERFRSVSGGRKFCFEVITDLSDKFQVSQLASIMRFVEVGTHEILVVFSSSGRVSWFLRSDDFPYMNFRFKVGGQLPPTSVAGEAYRFEDRRYTDVQEVTPEDWFFPSRWTPDRQMYEQCFFSDVFDYVVSVIWFE